MKSILLCEGKSDAILISYYLNKVKNWKFYGKKDKRKVKLPIRNHQNEEVNWYRRNHDLLAICEMGEEENHIVNKSKEYISAFDLIHYLNTQRLKVKGELAVTLGTMFPQKTFTPIDSMLKNINWEEYRIIQEGFRKLEEI